VCWWRVALQRNLTFIAPEDGRVSPKHVELKVHNKYSIALSW